MHTPPAKHCTYRPWAVRTVVVRLSRKLTATYRIRIGRALSHLLAVMLSGIAPQVMALPADGTVVGGQATITTPTANSMVVNQVSDKAILNWQSFNIGAGQSMQFVQPSAAAVALNRVIGNDASKIYGSLRANGQVFLINPSGVMFAPGAQVNVGGLVASTLAIGNEDFMAGRYTFSSSGGSGSVANHGNITVARGGYVLLAAPSVSNTGSITTDAGATGLVAGSRVTLDTSGAGLVRFSVDAAAVDAVAANSGVITAQGGQVAVLASALGDAMATVVNQSGVIRATSATESNGMIVLSGGRNGVVHVSGELDASGGASGQTGGTVKVLGDKVVLASVASIDASGSSGGGTVLVGGNYQGKGAEQNAAVTLVSSGATIDASATRSGDGGKVVVWADGATGFYGAIKATGGADAGNGGFAEVSGKQTLAFDGAANLSAPRGSAGTLLLDPLNIVVSAAGPATYADVSTFAAQAGTTQTVSTATLNAVAGNITLQASNDISLNTAFTVVAGKSVSFEANNNINITTGNTLATSGGGAITLKADADGLGGGNLALGAALTSQGGAITLSGANITGTAAGTVTSTGASNTNGGAVNITATGTVNLAGAITTTGGTATAGNIGRNAGAVSMTGAGVTAAAISASGSSGVTTGDRSGGAGAAVSITSTNGITQTGTIAASGGAGVNNGAGGNAGTITISNSGTGNISTGALTVQTGSAAGTGAGGDASGTRVSVTNTAAAGTLTTGAITTTGGTKGHGGNVVLSSAGTAASGNITTSGGTTLTGNSGRNAGTVSITGAGVNRGASTITASGSAGVGTSQTGGNGAAVSVTSTDGVTGTGLISASGGAGSATNGAGGNAGSIAIANSGAGAITTGALTVQTGAAVGTGLGGTAGSVSVTNNAAGANVTTGAINTAGFAKGAGGNISISAAGAGVLS
ncbi:MAG TPA: filamentous hemagglutinin N-terminal domain-containing protein, partial [Polaromonas sp.]|uniref:beta strand repeat-containing protein n=1 Tax=Polaromonas sp. TaxID=1869339 RepID=UPI002D6799B1